MYEMRKGIHDMSSSHHGSGKPFQQSPEQLASMNRLLEQLEGRAKRNYPQGRAGATDEGELAMAIAADPVRKLVVIDFGKPVDWLGLGEKETRGLIQMLIEKLRVIATEPVVIEV